MTSGRIVVEWDSLGHLDIKTDVAIHSDAGRKAAVEKLLDAARAVNNQGTPLVLPPPGGTRLLSPNGR